MPQLKAMVYIAFEGLNAGWQMWCIQTKSTREERLNIIRYVRVVLTVYKHRWLFSFHLPLRSNSLWSKAGWASHSDSSSLLYRGYSQELELSMANGGRGECSAPGSTPPKFRSWGYLWTWMFVSPLALIQDSGKLPSILWSPRQWQCLVQLSVQR